MVGEQDHPLRPVAAAWLEKIRQAVEVKARRFGKEAEEGMLFFSGPYDWLYDGARKHRHFVPPEGADFPRPSFQMTLNKASELVQLFGPSLYHRNPVRQVNPRKWPMLAPDAFLAVAAREMKQQEQQLGPPLDPMMAQQQAQMQAQFLYQQALTATEQGRAIDQARSEILSSYQNYTPHALDLKTESRWAIDEALIKGMGLLYSETYTPPGAKFKLAGSFYDSVDNLVIDPDATSLRDAKWVARRCCHPVWEVERKYGLPPGSLKGNRESVAQASEMNTDPTGDYFRKQGRSNDLITYWKVYSKMGLGGRLKGNPDAGGVLETMRPALDTFGDYCFVAVADGVPYPLNVPPAALSLDPEQARPLVQWESPLWADDGWPFTPIYFHTIPGDPWPQSHLAPGMGELKCLNWIYSFIASKIAVTARDFIALRKGLAEEMKTQIESGRDLTILEIEQDHPGAIQDLIAFLQHPQFNKDIWLVAQAIGDQFDRRVGLTELMYGESSRQMRSAEEAQVKSSQTSVRPDDMANKVEDAMSAVARAEAIVARWHLKAADVAPVLGPVGAWYWGQFIESADVGEIVHGLEYRIEAGSAKRPNRQAEADNMAQVIQTVFQPLVQIGQMTGDFSAANSILREWGKTMDMDFERLGIFFPNVPMPAPAAPPPGKGAPQDGGPPA